MILIKDVCEEDIRPCLDIYNYYIENSCFTLEEKTVGYEEFKNRIREIKKKYPFVVARDDNGTALGYAYLDTFNSRSAYRITAELSIYVSNSYLGIGIGSLLLNETVKKARLLGIENIVSLITSANSASIAFHKKNGFAFAGELKNAAIKFGEYQSLSFYSRSLA